jgi:glucokinase
VLSNKFLVGDVGGTTTRLAIMNRSMSIIYHKHYVNREIESFEHALKDFLSVCGVKPSVACLAVAGPLNHERDYASLTNILWNIDAKELQQKYHFKKVILLNDFEAVGLSMNPIKNSQYTELTSKGFDTNGITTILGAGTGLGTSILYVYYGKHYPIASEGGHTDLTINPGNKLEMDFYNYLKKKNILIETESALSGQGIVNMYEFMLTKKYKHDKKVYSEIRKASHDEKPALITRYALQDKDVLCIKVVELFIMFYARMARNLTLLTLSSNVVIAGGIAPKILPALQDMFLEAFIAHEQQFIRKMLENVSILVITDANIALYGCANALTS